VCACASPNAKEYDDAREKGREKKDKEEKEEGGEGMKLSNPNISYSATFVEGASDLTKNASRI